MYIKLGELMKCAGMVGVGIVVGALFSLGAIQLPILIEATWEGENRQIRFDSRTENICEVEEVVTQKIEEDDPVEQ